MANKPPDGPAWRAAVREVVSWRGQDRTAAFLLPMLVMERSVALIHRMI